MLMTPGNLGAIKDRPSDQFVIVTTWEDHVAISKSAAFSKLTKIMRVEFILVDGIVDISSSHQAMSECYAMAMCRQEVIRGKTYFLFLTPDSFWPEGTFQRLTELVDRGVKVVMACGLRVNSEAISTILRERIARFPDNPAIPHGELIRLALANLHQLSSAHNILGRDTFLNTWPSHIYWLNRYDSQLVAHCFHLHPLLVLSPKFETAIGTTIDGEFLDNLGYSLDCFHVIQDGIFGIELSPEERDWGQPLGAPSIKEILRFSFMYANSRHWNFFGRRIVLNGHPEKAIDPQIEGLADRLVSQIEAHKSRTLIYQKFGLHHVVRHIWPRFSHINNILRGFKKRLRRLASQ